MFGSTQSAAARNGSTEAGYRKHRKDMAERSRKQSATAREISDAFPIVQNPQRRARCLANPPLFLRTYFPDRFTLAFSDNHKRLISAIETGEGLTAVAMPRGDGKTAVILGMTMRRVIMGRDPYIVLIGATQKHSRELLEALWTECESNELLLEDFPEVFFPLHCLEGIKQRRMLWHGESIRMGSTKDRIIFPNLPPNPAASSCIVVASMTGRLRGLTYTRPDGRVIRPTRAILDDPQTERSANSPSQCEKLERTISRTILGLAGPNVPMSVVMACTVIVPNDLSDRFLSGECNKRWLSIRTKMVDEWHKGEEADKRWEEYRDLYNAKQERQATALFRKHRAVMENGAHVSWPQRRYPGTLSAYQHCMNLRITMGEAAFDAEYQNSPHRENETDDPRLTPDEVAYKINRIPRQTVDAQSSALSAFIDVQGNVLFYVVCGWGAGFSGSVIDYGSWPDQGQAYWTKAGVDPARTYAAQMKNAGTEAQRYNALDQLTRQILDKRWQIDGGKGSLTIGRCLIDYGWGESSDIIFEFCRQSPYRNILLPSKGLGKKASDVPMSDWAKRDGETSGTNWRVNVPPKRSIRHCVFDTNFWKSFVEERIRTPMGGKGGLTLFGDRPGTHSMLADHICAEDRIRTTNQRTGRTIYEWKEPLPGHDNDLFDCLVGCAVGASIQGISLTELTRPKQRATNAPRTRINMPTADGRSFFVTNR